MTRILLIFLHALLLHSAGLALVLSHDWGSDVADTDTKALHLFRSRVDWTHSADDAPVHCLISSVQHPPGLPRHLLPVMMPCSTCIHKLFALTSWPKYCNFFFLTSARKRRFSCNSSSIELLVLCSIQLIRIILRYMFISNAFNLLLSIALIV